MTEGAAVSVDLTGNYLIEFDQGDSDMDEEDMMMGSDEEEEFDGNFLKIVKNEILILYRRMGI